MRKFLLIFIPIILLTFACKKDPMPDSGTDNPNPVDPDDLTSIEHNPQPLSIAVPDYFPNIEDFIPMDNPTTIEGVELGRHLFYDPMLSVDSTISCSSCHLPAGGFTDNVAFSTGVLGEQTPRSSMALINVAYITDGLFWDGRIQSLEDQALMPVEDPIEMHEEWGNVEVKFRRHDLYPEMFRKAFDIDSKKEITKDLAVKALAQFERTLISQDSKFDKWKRNEIALDDDEIDGFLMFFDEGVNGLPDAECGHCHNQPLFTTNDFFNNGLDAAETFEDFTDKGLGAFTGRLSDNGKFRAPTLRNIALTAPYMHDGRFQTLEEVVEHYNSGGHPADNKDPLLTQLGLDDEQKQSIIAFLKTLTDEKFVNNPAYQNPFE
ncbi:MAG: cytochrome-c peroxidase [Saprospiraceae bacterium]